MSELPMKMALAEGVRKLIAPEIARQTKEIVIPEVVRLVFDHHHELGISILPVSQNASDHRTRKETVTARLCTIYALYECRDASVRDIVTDLIAVAQECALKIVILCAVEQPH